jgi:hypothetical protein
VLDFCCSHEVLTGFLSSSQHVPNSSSSYPMSFALEFYFCSLLCVIGTMCSVNMILVFFCVGG